MVEHMGEQRYEKLKLAVIGELMSKAGNQRKAIIHLAGVADLCALIALRRGLDPELCKCAGLLHDLWLYISFPVTGDMHRRHGYFGAAHAQDILASLELFTQDEIDRICEMIYNHNDKNLTHNIWCEALKDADALEHYLNNSDYDKRYRYGDRIDRLREEFGIEQL
ncbi:MAG: HD domain-containing protein [Eubacteriales bacterium]